MDSERLRSRKGSLVPEHANLSLSQSCGQQLRLRELVRTTPLARGQPDRGPQWDASSGRQARSDMKDRWHDAASAWPGPRLNGWDALPAARDQDSEPVRNRRRAFTPEEACGRWGHHVVRLSVCPSVCPSRAGGRRAGLDERGAAVWLDGLACVRRWGDAVAGSRSTDGAAELEPGFAASVVPSAPGRVSEARLRIAPRLSLALPWPGARTRTRAWRR